MSEPLKALKAELDRTGVISEAFKSLILSMAMNVAAEAYERGRADAKKERDT